jgi:hypothetical protein
MAATEFANLWTGQYPWQLISIILVSISFSFAAIAYMLAKVFRSDGLKKFANSEFLAALSTLLLVSMIVLFITFFEDLAMKFAIETLRIFDPAYSIELQRAKAAGKNVTIFSYPIYYLEKVINCSEYAWILSLCIDIPVEVTVSYQGIMASPGQTLRNMMHEVNSTLSYLIFLLYIQKHVLIFASQTMLTVFLPIGIVCRAFPLTRGIGNTFIAVAVGLYFVFPLSYYMVLAGFYFPNIESQCKVTVAKNPLDSFTTGGCAAVLTGSSLVAILPSELIKAAGEKLGIRDFFESGNPILRILAGGSAVAGSAAIASEIYNLFFRGIIVDLNIFAIVVPLVATAITLTFIRSFAILIGARAEDLVQGIIKLI